MEETKQTLVDLLEKIAKEQEYVDHTVDLTQVSTDGSNMTSILYRATIRAEGKPDLNLFAKVALMSEQFRKTFFIKDQFATELYFYTKLVKEYERIQEKYGVTEEHKLRMPKLYGSHDEYLSEIVVLDDLISMGFKNFNRNKSSDLEYVTTAIDLMAKFHALSLAFHHDDPEGFQKASDFLSVDVKPMMELFPVMRPNFIANALKSVNDEHKEKLEKFLTTEPDPLLRLLETYAAKDTNIILHGDFKPSNLMHRQKDGKLEIMPVDFQLLFNGDPMRDLTYFLITATDEAFCRKHYHEMLDLYYERLRLALSRFQIDVDDVFSESTYRAQQKENSMLALIIGLTLLPMVLAEEEKLPSLNDEFQLTDLVVEGSQLYNERLNGLINNYVEWGLL